MKPVPTLSFDDCDEILELIAEALTADDELEVTTLHSAIRGLELVVASHAAWAQTPSRRAEVRALAARLAELRADVQVIGPVVSRFEVH